MLRVTGGPKQADAAASVLLYPAAAMDLPTNNVSFNETRLNAAAGYTGTNPVLQVDATLAPGSQLDAIYGLGKGDNGWGVKGIGGSGTSPTSYGVFGIGGSSSGSFAASPGVRGTGGTGSGTGDGGVGVLGIGGFKTTGAAKNGMGVQGVATDNTGVFGVSTAATGVHGTSTHGVGLRGTSANFVGLVGISDNSIGLYGFTVAPNVPAFYAEHLGPFGRIAGSFLGDVHVQGNFTVSGAKNAAVPMADGSEAVMYCQESPEPYFEDFGRARLVNGQAHVQLEPEFASIVKRDDYMVFITPGGDSNGLYVSQQNPNGFDVRESKGGKSDLPFTYRIVARRKDIPGKRLERLDPKIKQNLAAMRAQSASKSTATPRAQGIEAPLVPMEPIPPVPPEPAPKPR
jgi:hypothetical protein